MKTITIALDDDLYETASAQAAKSRKSLSVFLRDVFSSGLGSGDKALKDGSATLKALWELADAQPEILGSVGRLNRDDLYERKRVGDDS